MDQPVALVTGGTRGIGRAIVDALAPTHRVLVGGRDARAVQTVCDEIPGAEGFVADLSDVDAVARAAADVERCDVLVHSAGVASNVRVEALTREAWRDMFDVNVFAVAQLTTLLLPTLRAQRGHVITINSGAGFRAGVGYAAYSGSKFALRAFTDALRLEEPDLRVTSIHPGRTATDMQEELWATSPHTYDPADHMAPADVAATVRLAVDMPAAANISELSIRPTADKNP